MIKEFEIKSSSKEQLIDITSKVASAVKESGTVQGICVVYTPHTTAGITINENADPAVVQDILSGMKGLNFEKMNFTHMEGNSAAHIKSSLFGCSETIIIDKGQLLLGTWQGIYFCEFDGPRKRTILVKII